MKLITLNIWGGHVLEPLLNFMVSHHDVDIFCLQEVYQNCIFFYLTLAFFRAKIDFITV